MVVRVDRTQVAKVIQDRADAGFLFGADGACLREFDMSSLRICRRGKELTGPAPGMNAEVTWLVVTV